MALHAYRTTEMVIQFCGITSPSTDNKFTIKYSEKSYSYLLRKLRGLYAV